MAQVGPTSAWARGWGGSASWGAQRGCEAEKSMWEGSDCDRHGWRGMEASRASEAVPSGALITDHTLLAARLLSWLGIFRRKPWGECPPWRQLGQVSPQQSQGSGPEAPLAQKGQQTGVFLQTLTPPC